MIKFIQDSRCGKLFDGFSCPVIQRKQIISIYGYIVSHPCKHSQFYWKIKVTESDKKRDNHYVFNIFYFRKSPHMNPLSNTVDPSSICNDHRYISQVI